jgi:hypothetical protein
LLAGAATASFSKESASLSPVKDPRPFTLDSTAYSGVDWTKVPMLVGTTYKHKLPDSVESLLYYIDANEALEDITKSGQLMQVAPDPFSKDGGTR